MSYIDDLDFGDEIRGVVCPECGGSLVWNKSRAYCYDDGYVKPTQEEASRSKLSPSDKKWLADHKHELEPEID